MSVLTTIVFSQISCGVTLPGTAPVPLTETSRPTWTASPIPPTSSSTPSSTPTPTITQTATITSTITPTPDTRPHPVVLMSSTGGEYKDWNDLLPDQWSSSSGSEAEYIVVIGEEREINLGSQAYNIGPDITAYRYETDVELRSRRTGQTLATHTFIGSDPPPFPETAPVDQTRLEGTHLVYPMLEDWLCPNVMRQGCWTLVRTLQGTPDGILGLAFSPDGQQVVAATGYTHLQVSQVSDGALLSSGQLDIAQSFWSAAFSPDGEIMASAGNNNTWNLWRISDRTLLLSIEARTSNLTFSPDGQMLASGSGEFGNYYVQLWHASDGTPVRKLEGHEYPINSLAFSPDGQILASGSNDCTIRLWNVVDGSLLRILEPPPAPPGQSCSIHALTFSPDGQTLASDSGDYGVRLWQVADGVMIRTLMLLHNPTSLAYSPDGQILAAGVADSTVHLWRVSDGSLLRTLEGNRDNNSFSEGNETKLAFSSDGQTLAISAGYGTVRLWQIR